MESRPVVVAQLGCGNWGTNLLRTFSAQRRCRVKWAAEESADRRSYIEATYPHTRSTADWQVAVADPEVQAVVVATPAPSHFRLASAALAAGKHVFVEKPMALGVRDAEELVSLAGQQGRTLMVGHLLEYHPAVDFIKRRVEDGTLGELYYIYCQRLNLGVVRRDENAFWSLAPHDISVILYLFGATPDRVTATGQCYLQPGVEDVVFANLHFADGRMAQIHVSWLDPHKERKMVVVGSKRMLVFDDMQASEKIRIYDKGANPPPAPPPGASAGTGAVGAINVRHGDIVIPRLPAAEPLDLEVKHFLDCVIDRTTPRSDGHDGLRVVRVLDQVDRILKQTRGGPPE